MTTDINEYDGIPGMMWADCVVFDSSGRLSCLCVNIYLESSGIVTVIGFMATDMFLDETSVTRK